MPNETKKQKINIGLDIGIASVGWAILNDNYEIIDMGSRLFPDAADPQDGSLGNEKRRIARHMRRRLRRARVRKNAFIKLVFDNNDDNLVDLIEGEDKRKKILEILEGKILEKELENSIWEHKGYYRINATDGKKERLTMIEAKVMGLREKLPKDLLISVLFHYLKHRGYFYESELDKENIEKNETNSEKSNSNTSDYWQPDLINKHPSQNQLDFFRKFGYYMGAKENARYDAKSYLKEIETLLQVQGLSKSFSEKYKKLFWHTRDYSEGPGSIQAPTIYGRFQKKGKETPYKNLWEKTIGKCSVYPDCNRGGKYSPKAELFNFLNDLNNLHIDGDETKKLSKQIKQTIVDKICLEILDPENNKFGLLQKDNEKVVGKIEELIKKDDPYVATVNGFRTLRVEKKNVKKKWSDQVVWKKIITPLNNLVKIARWLQSLELIDKNFHILDQKLNEKTNMTDLDFINNVYDCASRVHHNKRKAKNILVDFLDDFTEIKSQIQLKYPDSNPEDIVSKFVEKLSDFTQTHSLSYRAMDDYIKKVGIEKSENQSQFFPNRDLNRKDLRDKLSKVKRINKTIFKDEIISPTARRAFIQTINVLNKILKVYSKNYDINNITIELARNKNTYAENKSNKDEKNKNNALTKEILRDEHFLDDQKCGKIRKFSNTDKLVWKLAEEQDWTDLYDGRPIQKNNFISSWRKYYQIDHIIPWRRSLNDSFMNKTITSIINNQSKGNRTPYEWLGNEGKYDEFEKRFHKLSSMNQKKIEDFYLNKSNDFLGFINRNLVDTRYASRRVLNLLQIFFKLKKEENKDYPSVKIKVVRGIVTSYARKKFSEMEYKKSRDLGENKNIFWKNRLEYKHHAVDAVIIAFLGCNEKLKRFFQYNEMIEGHNTQQSYQSIFEEKNIDQTTGEVIKANVDEKLFNDSIALKFKDNLKKWIIGNEPEKRIKFSRAIRTRKNRLLANETIYSIKWTNSEKKEGKKIETLSIFDKEKMEKIFSNSSKNKNVDNILLKKNNPVIFNKLKEIWNNYKCSEKKSDPSPFFKFMEFSNEVEKDSKGDVLSSDIKHLKFNDGKLKFKLANLRIEGDSKESENILVLKNHKKEGSQKAGFLESLNPLEARIYWNENAKRFEALPINARFLKSFKDSHYLEIDENKIYKFIRDEKKWTTKSYDELKCYRVFNGSTIIKKKEEKNEKNIIYYFIGSCTLDRRLEVKPIDFFNNASSDDKKSEVKLTEEAELNEKDNKKGQKQIRMSLSKIVKTFNICELDELGKIYNEKTFYEYFDLQEPKNTSKKSQSKSRNEKKDLINLTNEE